MYADLSIWDYFIEHLKLLLIYRFMDESEWSVPASLHDHYLVLSWLTQLKKCNRNNSRLRGCGVSNSLILESTCEPDVSTSIIIISKDLNLQSSEVWGVIQTLESGLV